MRTSRRAKQRWKTRRPHKRFHRADGYPPLTVSEILELLALGLPAVTVPVVYQDGCIESMRVGWVTA